MSTDFSRGQDAEHLRLLSVFHYVVAGLLGVFSLFPVIHLTLGILMVTGQLDDANPPPALFGWMFVLLPALMILGGLALALCMAVAGYKLGHHRAYTYCLVVAAVECLFMPFGTVLGVFTIIVLMRPSVKERFGVTPAP